jgi:type IV secretion system protein VirB9
MKLTRRMVAASTLVLSLGACATRIAVPEIPILDSPAFKAAKREPEPRPHIEYVEVPKPLPLPGQLKPVTKAGETRKDEPAPKDRVVGANAAARIEPVEDGYINAIQVYPYTTRSPTSPCSRVRSWCRCPPAIRCGGWSAIPPAARARTQSSTSW